MKSSGNCIYAKEAGRYRPIGVCEPINYIPNGIWYVRSKPGCRSTTNCEYIGEMFKIGDAEDISINKLCGLEKLCDEVFDSKEYRDAVNNDKGYCLQDVTHAVVKFIWDKYGEH